MQTNEGPSVVLGCLADGTGKSWDTWKGKKVPPAKFEPLWENPAKAKEGSTWGTPALGGTGYY